MGATGEGPRRNVVEKTGNKHLFPLEILVCKSSLLSPFSVSVPEVE